MRAKRGVRPGSQEEPRRTLFTVRGGLRPLLAVAAIGGGLLGLQACGGGGDEAPAIQTAVVVRQNMRITAEATGQVEPVQSVEVKSKASGEVLRLHVDVGDYVEPGTLLAEIDPRDVRNSYNQAQADLEVARARVEISRAQFERSKQLLDAGVITEQDFEQQNLDYANARATLVKAETNLELANLRLSDVTIRAPIAGTILTRNVEEGTVIQSASSNVSGGTTLFVMANLDEVQIRTLVDETDVGQIRAGLEATVQVEAYPGRTFAGYVEKIEPQAVNQQNVTMFPVIIRLDNRQGLLKPGMNAEVEMLLVERPNVLVVPNNAVVLMQEVAPAASVLGLDPEGIELDRSAYSELAQAAGLGPVAGLGGRRGSRGSGGAAAPGGAAARAAPQTPGAADAGAAPGAASPGSEGFQAMRARMDSLRAQVERGEISEDSLNAIRASFRSRMGAGAAQGASGGERTANAAGFAVAEDFLQESNPALSGLLNTSGNPRPAVAFVMTPDSTLEVRPVLMGVNDWDNTEILAGLEEGEMVALIGVAQLQAEQEEMRNRMMGRGMFPGMGRR